MCYAIIYNDINTLSVKDFVTKHASEYCLTASTFITLVQMHRDEYWEDDRCGHIRKQIEDVFTDLNYHTECAMLRKGKYKELLEPYKQHTPLMPPVTPRV